MIAYNEYNSLQVQFASHKPGGRCQHCCCPRRRAPP